MTTRTNETQIIVDTEVPLVRIIREFDAPVTKVFRAHVTADLFSRWIGPAQRKAQVEHFDCRTGGSYRYVIDGEYGFYGSFHEIRPDALIVQTFTFAGMPDGIALEKLTFEDLGEGRSRLHCTSLVDSFADRDAFVSSGMEEGVRDGYLKLDALLTDI